MEARTPIEEKPTPLTFPVPDFFQDDGDDEMRQRATWAISELGFTHEFFARLLEAEGSFIRGWLGEEEPLTLKMKTELQNFWDVILHLLSRQNSDIGILKRMLDENSDTPTELDLVNPDLPPWLGTSIRSYLGTYGPEGVEKLNRWISGLRFR